LETHFARLPHHRVGAFCARTASMGQVALGRRRRDGYESNGLARLGFSWFAVAVAAALGCPEIEGAKYKLMPPGYLVFKKFILLGIVRAVLPPDIHAMQTKVTPYLIGAFAAFAVVAVWSFSKPVVVSEADKKIHRIVFHITTPDTAAYRALGRQLDNVLTHWPAAQLEVVAHNKGINMLVKEKTNVHAEIGALKTRGVQFFACENTLKQQKLDKSQIVSESGFVPVGIAEVVEKQEQGWAYIKAGF
jgi:uncharacterized protein